MEVNIFKEQMTSSPLLASGAGFLAWALPIGELILAVILFIPAWRLKGLYLSGILMTLFTVYVIIILLIDNHISCSCGGIIEDLSPRQHLLFNIACILLSASGIWAFRKNQPTLRFKWLITGATACLFGLIGWTLFSAFSAPATVKTGMEGRLLPPFNILLQDSATLLNTADIPTGKQLIFIGFSPICIHCQQETREILSHMDQFNKVHFYFVTPFDFKEAKEFYLYFGMNKYPNISMGIDSSNYFFKYFKAPGAPYTAVFDSKKRLKQVMSERFDVNELIKAVKE